MNRTTADQLPAGIEACDCLTPFGDAPATGTAQPKSEPVKKTDSNEIDTLKQEMEAMRKQLAELAKK